MLKFNKVCVFSFEKNNAYHQLKTVLSTLGVNIVSEAEDADLLMVLGGDGTMLHQAKLAHNYQIPIVGINLGNTGFLADVQDAEYDVIHAILSGQYTEDQRQVLQCDIAGETYYAINEVMVSKQKPTRMVKYEVIVDDRFLYEQTADGMIVCTTTGSTAYALSAGGAILHPDANILGLIPVCPSKITSRPMIICDKSRIEIILHDWKDSEQCIAVDAQTIPVKDKRIMLTLSDKKVTFLHPLHYDYYQTLQTKLNWEMSPK